MARNCKEAIVVFNGCFCPVHAGHVKALMDTKQKLEAHGNFHVVAGYFAVAPDNYVRRKVDGGLEPWMTSAVRVDLCKAVAEDVKWIVSADECESWKRCGRAMVDQYHSASTVVFGVREEAKKGGVSKKGDGETAELSSTRIRAEFARRGCTPEVVDHLVLQGVLGPAVGECLKQKLGSTKWVDCICCDGTGRLLGMECPLCDGSGGFHDEETLAAPELPSHKTKKKLSK
eukprot:CAMPEP_0204567960 /NCGR_PEP_ID=MMETSP0661-20131031/36894_1 /ASSEMBLY_ACC=CAM_ASM_000606 /TAXON_ID=109239 /ORGANISM="Alexandrium margalefi, Strain AMGDE01CS-322" /LENGTH=229 /DNA_ID=CAMNT_0051575925 /DNA_START=42 /DNA_END=731 /DNA_ORIENTATION=+